jgi:hypothetical protein
MAWKASESMRDGVADYFSYRVEERRHVFIGQRADVEGAVAVAFSLVLTFGITVTYPM